MTPYQISQSSLFLSDIAEATGMQKQGSQAAPRDYSGLALQSYLPVAPRRELTADEDDRIAKRKKALLPKIFTSLADRPEVDISTPWLPAGLGGGIGAILGGGVGDVVSKIRGDDEDNHVAAILGALLGGGLGGVIGYKGKATKNDDIIESMRRIPEGGTRRDIESDPLVQVQRERDFQRGLNYR